MKLRYLHKDMHVASLSVHGPLFHFLLAIVRWHLEHLRKASAPASTPYNMASVVPANTMPGDWPRWLIERIKNDPNGIDQRWTGGWHLGDGGGGLASLWTAFDERSNSAIDRMVVKVLALNHADWWDPTKWSDGINAVGYRNFAAPINHNQPQEAIVMQRLSTIAIQPPPGARRHPLCKYRGKNRHRYAESTLEAVHGLLLIS